MNNINKYSENHTIQSISKQLESIEQQKQSLLFDISNFLPSNQEKSQKLINRSMRLLKNNEDVLKSMKSENGELIDNQEIQSQNAFDIKISEFSTAIDDENSEGRTKESQLYKQMNSFLFSLSESQNKPKFYCNSLENNGFTGKIDFQEFKGNEYKAKQKKFVSQESKKIKKVKKQRKTLNAKNCDVYDAVKDLLQETRPNFEDQSIFCNNMTCEENEKDFNDLFICDYLSNQHSGHQDTMIDQSILANDLLASHDQYQKFQDPILHNDEQQKILDLYSHISVIESMLNQTKQQLSQLLQ